MFYGFFSKFKVWFFEVKTIYFFEEKPKTKILYFLGVAQGEKLYKKITLAHLEWAKILLLSILEDSKLCMGF